MLVSSKDTLGLTFQKNAKGYLLLYRFTHCVHHTNHRIRSNSRNGQF